MSPINVHQFHSSYHWYQGKQDNHAVTPYPFKTHWGRVTHICVGKLTIIGSDNGLSPARRQAIIWTSAGILLIGPLRTNFSEILIGIQTFLFTKMHLKMSSAKWRPFCLGHNVLTTVSPLGTGDASKYLWCWSGIMLRLLEDILVSIFEKLWSY